MAQTVIGMFDNASEAQRAVQELESRGFSRSDIDISTRGSNETGTVSDSYSGSDSDRERSGGGNAVSRFFNSLFGDDDNDREKYSRVAQSSSSIVTVHARSNEEAERAADILDDCGAVDVDERSSGYGAASNTRSADLENTRSTGEGQSIPVIQENLEVGKRTVESGGVRVRSRIVERPVEEHVRLREDHVWVERNPVNRPVSGDELRNFQETNIELTEQREVPVVNKEARVVEEVRLGKETQERDETIRDTVRNTDVDVENLGRSDSDLNRGTSSDMGRSNVGFGTEDLNQHSLNQDSSLGMERGAGYATEDNNLEGLSHERSSDSHRSDVGHGSDDLDMDNLNRETRLGRDHLDDPTNLRNRPSTDLP